MRKVSGLVVVVCIAFANLGRAQSADQISGQWLITRIVFGSTQYHRITLKLENGKVTGAFGSGRKIEGTLRGNELHFIARDDNSTIECTATLSGGTLSGKFVETFPNDPKNVQESAITASRIPEARSGPPQRHEFTPTIFYREFSASPQPVNDGIVDRAVDSGLAVELKDTGNSVRWRLFGDCAGAGNVSATQHQRGGRP